MGNLFKPCCNQNENDKQKVQKTQNQNPNYIKTNMIEDDTQLESTDATNTTEIIQVGQGVKQVESNEMNIEDIKKMEESNLKLEKSQSEIAREQQRELMLKAAQARQNKYEQKNGFINYQQQIQNRQRNDNQYGSSRGDMPLKWVLN